MCTDKDVVGSATNTDRGMNKLTVTDSFHLWSEQNIAFKPEDFALVFIDNFQSLVDDCHPGKSMSYKNTTGKVSVLRSRRLCTSSDGSADVLSRVSLWRRRVVIGAVKLQSFAGCIEITVPKWSEVGRY